MTTPTTDASLLTTAERSDFIHTGRYVEAERLCAAYAAQWPDAVRCFDFGVTPEGRTLRALIVSRTGALDAKALHTQNVPVLALQGGIHPGESDGKDAGFMVLRDLLGKPAKDDPLKKIAILFIPVFNVDGHERFGKWNRPNQVGPAEMGWRTNAQNLNLNRDYMKADAPEMQAMLRLLTAWDPILYADLHVTDGADFQHDVSVQLEPIQQSAVSMRATGIAIRDAVIADLAAQGSLPLSFYPNLIEEDNPASGFAESAYLPRFSTGYWALRNRYSLLLETHSWKDYKTRVRVTVNTLVSLVQQTAAHGAAWLKLARVADAEAMQLGGKQVELDHEAGPHVTMIDFKGYAYTREPSAISGGLVTRYDPATPQVWHVPYHDTVVPTLSVRAPKAGYVVAAGYAAPIAERLAAHGIAFQTLAAPKSAQVLETFRATEAKLTPGTFEGRSMMAVKGAWAAETRALPAGSLFIPIAQPQARVVAALLEPQAPDSFLSWGFFNAAFEQKEYAEPYVAEQMAREMLAKDAALAAEFNVKLSSDKAFAASPAARLEFFYRRHPSWDEQYFLVPVYRLDVFTP
ncbi:MAG: M14 family metallopeptidase [Stagnimonas sp.]|nr:M14 family metallopeptidase [Stagnimonas sp.]